MARARNWSIYVDGVEDLARMFRSMGDAAESILDEAAKKAAEIVLTDAKNKVPVNTGKLKASLDIKPEKRRRPTKAAYQVYSKGVSKGGVRYAFAVEGGTSKMPARPFLRPALDENKDKIKDTISDELIRGIDRA